MDAQMLARIRDLTRAERRILRILSQHGTVRLEDLPARRMQDCVTFKLRGMGLIEPTYEGPRITAWTITELGRQRMSAGTWAIPHYRDKPGRGQLERAALEAAMERVRNDVLRNPVQDECDDGVSHQTS